MPQEIADAEVHEVKVVLDVAALSALAGAGATEDEYYGVFGGRGVGVKGIEGIEG